MTFNRFLTFSLLLCSAYAMENHDNSMKNQEKIIDETDPEIIIPMLKSEEEATKLMKQLKNRLLLNGTNLLTGFSCPNELLFEEKAIKFKSNDKFCNISWTSPDFPVKLQNWEKVFTLFFVELQETTLSIVFKDSSRKTSEKITIQAQIPEKTMGEPFKLQPVPNNIAYVPNEVHAIFEAFFYSSENRPSVKIDLNKLLENPKSKFLEVPEMKRIWETEEYDLANLARAKCKFRALVIAAPLLAGLPPFLLHYYSKLDFAEYFFIVTLSEMVVIIFALFSYFKIKDLN